MTADDILSQPVGQRVGSRASTIEHRVEVVLRALLVLIPPLAQGGHVVSRDGVDTAIGVAREVSEARGRILRHRLDLEREDAQLVHHPGHAVGHHTEILGTDEHAGGLCELGQLLHRLSIPELVVATVEVVVVELVEVILLILAELGVCLLILDSDTWMPAIAALVVDEEQTFVELHTVGGNLLDAHAEGRRELAHQTRLVRHGNLPDAEEAQHVVDAVGIEILGHLTESAHPPLTAVGEHHIPVISGESPVLAIGRESIGRSSCLSVQIEVLRLYPGLYAVAADADGDVALQDDALLAGIGMGGTHLLVEVELYEVPEGHLFIYFSSRLRHGLALLLCEGLVIGPLRERGGAVHIAVVTEGGVRHEPVLVLLEEGLKGLGLHHLTALLGEELAQIGELGIVHALVVDLWQGVELFLQGFVVGLALLVLQRRQLSEVGVLRMQRVDADRVVRIAVLPGVGHVRIVDGQHLQHALAGLGTPVDHLLQIAEVAHSEAAFTAQREDGDDGTCTLPRIDGEESLRQLVDDHLALLELRDGHRAVHSCLPKRRHVDLFVE